MPRQGPTCNTATAAAAAASQQVRRGGSYKLQAVTAIHARQGPTCNNAAAAAAVAVGRHVHHGGSWI
jgi:hypothetical protein